ncbi:hypothetical protein PHLCEN_2v4339 [Hermanssonia centrifuga]|uniref:Uncharacterized protein n=1 Tax=Hermanssonia centrifuga TaxID=98765 RepID=A0A2R6PW97_9APHY|nr:hypothetical protein PHLCEN_2v4339 [Hermanssonia centrifuga]
MPIDGPRYIGLGLLGAGAKESQQGFWGILRRCGSLWRSRLEQVRQRTGRKAVSKSLLQ